jgi:hypothetical protein
MLDAGYVYVDCRDHLSVRHGDIGVHLMSDLDGAACNAECCLLLRQLAVR